MKPPVEARDAPGAVYFQLKSLATQACLAIYHLTQMGLAPENAGKNDHFDGEHDDRPAISRVPLNLGENCILKKAKAPCLGRLELHYSTSKHSHFSHKMGRSVLCAT